MNKQMRLVTVGQGEEAVVRVNSSIPITLEFPGHVVTLWVTAGRLFQSTEKVEASDETTVITETDIEPYEETQLMEEDEAGYTQVEEDEFPATPPANVTIRQHGCPFCCRENPVSDMALLEDLRTELFGTDTE